jgi:hypothetical protein
VGSGRCLKGLDLLVGWAHVCCCLCVVCVAANADTDEEAPAHGPSLISIGGSAVAGAHASAAPTSGSAALNSAAGSAAAAPPQAVTVTNYQFPLAPLVLLAFVAGVVCSSFAKCMLDKREQLRRQENLIKPLLVPHN